MLICACCRRTVFLGVAWLLLFSLVAAEETTRTGRKEFRAGASVIDIFPRKLPAIISGGFLQGQADRLNDPLHARCLALDDGAVRLAIVVVDSLMMPRELIDDAKRRAAQTTGIPANRILVSAVHTHSAPSVMGALGTGVDEEYARLLPVWIAESVSTAVKNLARAKIGWAVVEDREHTHCRRWIYRPDRIAVDPFGERTIRAMMHPGYQNPDFIGPSGPVDPGLSVLAVQSPEGKPLAVLANYSMHYFGAAPVSADYFGRFSQKLAQWVGGEKNATPVVAMMSQGTSGDLHWMDYSQPQKAIDLDTYSEEVAKAAFRAYRQIQYRDDASLAMAEQRIRLHRREPDEKRLAWARKVVEEMGSRTIPQTQREVYALEQIYLHQEPEREVVLQAVRVGSLGITAMPNEVFGLTGLKIKAQSPLEPTFNIELANGGEGYIPPPEQHHLGGYTTWPARTAGLEVQAEPKIVEAMLGLLEQVAGKPRRKIVESQGPYTDAVLASQPIAYWRLGEIAGPRARDASGRGRDAVYGKGIALYLEGPEGIGLCGPGQTPRAAHFAGGSVLATIDMPGSSCSFEVWLYNGLPNNVRSVTGYFFSCEPATGTPGGRESVGIGGTATAPGRLFFSTDSKTSLVGTTVIPAKTWNHVVIVRNGKKATVFLNGKPLPEGSGEAASAFSPGLKRIAVGGRSDGEASFEGKMAEAALYDRALTDEEVARHYAAAGGKR